MYARLGKETGDAVTGAIEVCTLHRLAGFDELVLSLWPTEEQASADPTAEWYRLEADHPGGDRDQQPTVAALICFDGPMSEPVHAAAQRANTDRIGPRMADHQGTVRGLVLWQPERHRMVVVVLATSVEAIEDGQRAVMSTKLLPGEDPALLLDPDRVDLYRVRAAIAGSLR
jgi:hypothetical protein